MWDLRLSGPCGPSGLSGRLCLEMLTKHSSSWSQRGSGRVSSQYSSPSPGCSRTAWQHDVAEVSGRSTGSFEVFDLIFYLLPRGTGCKLQTKQQSLFLAFLSQRFQRKVASLTSLHSGYCDIYRQLVLHPKVTASYYLAQRPRGPKGPRLQHIS